MTTQTNHQIIKYAAKIKLTWWFVYKWGKPTQQKTSPGDFKVTISKNLLLSKQVVTSKGISILYTNQTSGCK